MGLYQDADRLGKQVEDKRKAAKAAKDAAQKAAREQLAKQKQREQDKKEGMI